MNRIVLLLFFALGPVVPAALMAQQMAVDSELQSLVSTVVSLRQSDKARQKAAFDIVKQALTANTKWTLMDELVDKGSGECSATDFQLPKFRLNRILNQVFKDRFNIADTRGDFLNGSDPNYDFSLLEKSVKAHKKVIYADLRGRQGEQDFVVVPFDAQGAKLSIVVKRGKDVLGKCATKAADGNYYLRIEAVKGIKTDDVLTIEIENKTGQDVAMVILNHNKRK